MTMDYLPDRSHATFAGPVAPAPGTVPHRAVTGGEVISVTVSLPR